MDSEQLVAALRQIQVIVDEALVGKSPKPRAKLLTSGPSVRREGLPTHILALREEGFFAQPKTFNEVHAKLESIYPCDVGRVKVACIRLQRRKQLRKTSKTVGNKSQVTYVW
jgi:hypothetical protein